MQQNILYISPVVWYQLLGYGTHYFSGSVKDGRQYAWLQDNMPVDVANITPASVFNGKWKPEEHLARIKAQIAIFETREVIQ